MAFCFPDIDEERSNAAEINYEPEMHDEEGDIRKKPRYTPGSRKGVGGRTPIEEKFPTLVPLMTEYIESNGFSAHRRRHDTTGNCGVTLEQVQTYLFLRVPGLKEHGCSVQCLSKLLKPPDKRFIASTSYRGLVDAKANPPKRTTMVKANDNDHYYSARTKYVMEMTTQFSDSTTVYSVDNKNKLRIGEDIPAVDRRCQNRRIFPTNDQPVLPDHDFHTSGMAVQIAGYLHVDLPPEGETDVDGQSREHFKMSRRGQLYVVNRSGVKTVTIADHVNDLINLITTSGRELKPNLVLVADNGADFRPNSITNEVSIITHYIPVMIIRK